MVVGETALFSLDGRGYQSINRAVSEPRYIYYRVFSEDSLLRSKSPIYSNDHFINRISPQSVAPPRTAASLKKRLCKLEGFEAVEKCSLYLSLSDKTPVEDHVHLSLRGMGPGFSELDPIALVVNSPTTNSKQSADARTQDSKTLPVGSTAQGYIHYRVYDEDGEVTSKTSFDETAPSLGRISALSVPPPYTVASLKRCLVKIEGISDRDFQLFRDDDGEIILNDGVTLDIHAGNYSGRVEDGPLAIVYRSQKKRREARVPEFLKRVRVTTEFESRHPKWQKKKVGDFFQTDLYNY